MSRAARLAERCFAVARSTTFAAERETAIARGVAIVEAAGLSLDDFDVPGRHRASRAAGTASHPVPFDQAAWEAELARHVELMRATAIKVPRQRSPDSISVHEIRALKAGLDRHTRGLSGSLEELYATLARRGAEVGAGADETVYDARRRNFEQATRR